MSEKSDILLQKAEEAAKTIAFDAALVCYDEPAEIRTAFYDTFIMAYMRGYRAGEANVIKNEQDIHNPTYVTVANGAGYIACTCGWYSRVQDDGKIFTDDYYDSNKAFKEHIDEQQSK